MFPRRCAYTQLHCVGGRGSMSDGILELFLRDASESGDHALGGNGSEGEHDNHTHGEEAHGAHGGHGTVLFLFTAFAVGG